MDVKETREILGGEQVQHRQEDRGEVIILSITAFSHKDTHTRTRLLLTLRTLICHWYGNTSILPCHLILPSSHRVRWINAKTEADTGYVRL